MSHFLKTTLAASLVCLTVNVAQADDDALKCTGANLMDQLKLDQPQVAEEIYKKAKNLPHGEGVLWKVSKEGVAPSYLFGTMHLSDPRLLDLGETVQSAFEESRTLALEITDILDPEAMKEKASGLVEYTAYMDGSTISSRLTPEQEKITRENFGKRSSIPWFLAKRLKPWALMGAMSLPACEQARKEAGKPFLDQSLAQKADKAGMKLVSLETVESQVKAMAALPEKTMVKALYETARMGSRIDDVFETMIQLYEKQQIGVVWAMMKHVSPDGMRSTEDDSGYADFQREIVDKRNHNMVVSALPLIEDGAAFVAVGALHLPGESGILNILAQKGYALSRM